MKHRSKLKYRLKPGDVVKHFSRERNGWHGSMGLYRILDIAINTDTDEEMVVYQALYENPDTGCFYSTFVRSVDIFFSEVDRDKYPDVKQRYKYELYEGGDCGDPVWP